MDNHKQVSLCTVSKNRLNHIQKTLLENILSNLNEPNIEFILLDYNSNDGLETWIKENLNKYIEQGIFSYYKTIEPEYFNRSHSRNMAFNLAKGDILCNVDADNYTGNGFVKYVKEEFNNNPNIFLCTDYDDTRLSCTGLLGRLCFSTLDFMLIGGFDEEMINYGFEDLDLVNRLQVLGRNKTIISNRQFINAISHNITSSISEEFPFKNIDSLFVSYITPSMSGLLFLFKNNTFIKGTLVNNISMHSNDLTRAFNRKEFLYEYSIFEQEWETGNYMRKNNYLNFKTSKGQVYSLHQTSNRNEYISRVYENTTKYYHIDNPDLVKEGIFFLSQMSNRIKMENNMKNSTVKVNPKGKGKGVVFKNFNTKDPIVL